MGFADTWMDETPLILRKVREQAHGDTGISAFLSMDASCRHPMEYGKCTLFWPFALLSLLFPFPWLPFGEVFDSDDGAMAAGALVGFSGCNFFGKMDFNKFLIHCALMSSLSSSKFLQPIPKMINGPFQWSFPTCELASTDERTAHPSRAETANLPAAHYSKCEKHDLKTLANAWHCNHQALFERLIAK